IFGKGVNRRDNAGAVFSQRKRHSSPSGTSQQYRKCSNRTLRRCRQRYGGPSNVAHSKKGVSMSDSPLLFTISQHQREEYDLPPLWLIKVSEATSQRFGSQIIGLSMDE